LNRHKQHGSKHCDWFKGPGGIVTGIEPVPLPHFVQLLSTIREKTALITKHIDLTQSEHLS